MYVKKEGKITNKEYQLLYNVSKRTATNDLDEIVQKKIFEKVGTRGKGTFHIIKRAIIGQRRKRCRKDALKGRKKENNLKYLS